MNLFRNNRLCHGYALATTAVPSFLLHFGLCRKVTVRVVLTITYKPLKMLQLKDNMIGIHFCLKIACIFHRESSQ